MEHASNMCPNLLKVSLAAEQIRWNPRRHKMFDKLRPNNKALRPNVFIIRRCTHTDTWVHMAFQWLTNTAVVVAGQLVTCVALTVVWALRVHTSVHAVVGQGTLVSVCRKTHTHRHVQESQEDMGSETHRKKQLFKRRYSDLLKSLTSGLITW